MPNQNGVLIGIPGGGKSTSIIERIIYQVDSGQIPASNGYLVVTFSRAAARDFKQKGMRRRADIFEGNHIRTIHSLAGTLVRSDSISTVVYRATKEIAKSPEVAAARYPAVRVIYIDEAQDISRTQYEFVCTMAEILNAAVVLIGDADQSLYAFQGGSPEFLLRHGGFRVELVQNYRSTSEIVALANAARPTRTGVQTMHSASQTSGPVPHIVSDDISRVSQRIVDIVRENMAANKCVAIIGPVKKSNYDKYSNPKNIGLQRIYHVLTNAHIPAQIHYKEEASETSSYDVSNGRENTLFSPNKVHLLTIHGSKGLEFDTVILLNFHKELMGYKGITAEDVKNYKCLIYVGFTRAKESLWVMHAYGREVWPEYHSYSHILPCAGEPIPPASMTVQLREKPSSYTWTRFLNDRQLVSEDQLAAFEDAADINKSTVNGPNCSYAHTALPDQDKLGSLYGVWAENVFENRYRAQPPKCFRTIATMIERLEVVSAFEHRAGIKQVIFQLGLDSYETVKSADFEAIEHTLNIREDTKEYISAALERHGGEVFFHIPDISRFLDTQVIGKLIADCSEYIQRSEYIPSSFVWKMCLFLFQYENECKYRWYFDYSAHIRALGPYVYYITITAAALEDGWIFDVLCELEFNNGRNKIRGFADAVHADSGRVIEIKFTNSFNLTHGLQAAGYTVMLNPQWKTIVYNLRTQKIIDVSSSLTPKMMQDFAENVAT